jgi:hypothetical protein
MRTLKNSIIMAGLAMTFLTGCFTTQDGKAKFTMIPGRSDNFQLRPNWPPTQAMQAVQEVLALEGTITSKETTKNTVTARVNERYVYVKVEADPESPDISLITFQARTKWRNPDLALVNRLMLMTVAQLGTYTRTTTAAASN